MAHFGSAGGRWQAFLAWWSPPVWPDGPETERSRALWLLSWSTLAIITIGLGILVAINPATASRRATSWLAVLALVLPIHLLNRRRLAVPASWLLVLGLVAIAAQRAWATGGVQAPVTPLFLIFVMMAGVLLGGWGATLTAVFAAACSFGLLIAERAGLIEASRTFDSRATFLLGVMITGLAVVVQRLASKTLRRSLARVQQELAARERAEAKLRLALDSAEVGIWELDPATNLLQADDRLFSLYGLDPGPDNRVGLDRWLQQVKPADREHVRSQLDSVLAKGGSVRTEFLAVRDRDDTRHVFGAAALLPRSDESGPRVVGVNVDVTDRRLAALERERLVHELKERVKELRLLHDAARLMQEHRGPVDRLLERLALLIPPAWQYPDYAEALVTIGHLEASTPGWRNGPLIQSIEFATSAGSGRIAVTYRQRPPGAASDPFLPEERTLLGSLAEILTSQIELVRHQNELESLVEKRTAELEASLAQLRQAEKLRDDLVHMVVHDLRSPLTGLIGRLELACEDATGTVASDLKASLESALHLQGMANTLLDVSRLEHGAMPLVIDEHDLAAVAAGVASELAGMDATRTIIVDAPEAIRAECDGGILRRVLQNLVSNGIKHSPRGGRLTIAVRTSEDRALVSVADEGPGIPEVMRTRIFEKFGAVAARKDHTYHSAGLGLAFCKLAIEAHAGQITITDAVPHGSIFAIDLPLRHARAQSAPAH